MQFTQQNIYISVSTPFGEDKLLLNRFHGEERISDLFRFTLEMVSEDDSLDFSSIVGQSVTVTMDLVDGSKRYINGIVGRFIQAGRDARIIVYQAEIYPWLWVLTLGSNSQIFQNQTTPDIIEAVFKQFGFSDYNNALSSTYQQREYVVQYQETAFNFVSRLMEDEGIFYFFEHEDGKHTLVLADDSSAFPDAPGLDAAHYAPTSNVWRQPNGITQAMLEQQMTPDQYAMDDYNFETPTTSLYVTATGNQGNLQLYEYPGDYQTTEVGQQKAKTRIQSYEVPTNLLKGEGYTRSFIAGYKFTLADFYRAAANTSYVLQRVSHFVDDDGNYTNVFEAFAESVTFHPIPTTPKPKIYGYQTATVTGPDGEEISTDQYGRVKVKFHWDQSTTDDENSSCWIRVAQDWAGKDWGVIFIPRVGQEVVVSFLDGDPDRPIIIGCVYNAQQTVPYPLPDNQTRSTIKTNSTPDGGDGYNEIRFEDKKGEEEIFIHAQKDMNVQVENNQFQSIQTSRQVFISDKDASADQNATGDNLTVNAQRTVAIKGSENVETHTNEGNFTQTVDKDYSLTVKGNLTITVDGAISIKGQSITLETTGGDLSLTSSANIASKADSNINSEASMSLTNKAGMSMTNEAGMDLTSSGSGSVSVESDGIVSVKGTLVQLN